MAGHSHAANVAVRKGKQDRLRARVFAKHSKYIMIAARDGADPAFNFALRHAIDKAKAVSMPNDKIDHAVKKGAGLIEGVRVEEIQIEAYGPGGVAMIVECVTDNANRTRPEIASILEKNGAKIAAANAVKWMFQRKGLFAVPVEKVGEEKLMDLVLEAGAEDLVRSDDVYEIVTGLESFESVRKALEDAGLETTVGEMKFLPDNEVQVEPDVARRIFKLVEKIEDNEDVNAVHTNLAYTEEVLKVLREDGE
ncbi:MAG: YebC/PmpR family DNA-binding transcriptional regulator [Planctomycetota bacterium]|nr:YebC/PmpR family DNA-binding transcriptional regulator [Planctomycetota bacterium]